ncbi:MAG: hypothetical protein Alpg2KO_29040 [Alphaproteobacteria bacterium]
MANPLVNELKGNPPEPTKQSAEEYASTLTDLVTKGAGFGKTVNVGAYKLENFKVVTETSSGEVETERELEVQDVYLIMDIDQYPTEQLRKMVVKDMARNWAGRVVHERDLQDPDYSAPGIWTNKSSAVEGDYKRVSDDSGEWTPDPDAYRVCLRVDRDIVIPVPWGEFKIEKGGHLAVRERDVPALAKALQKVASGKISAEKALLRTNDKGQIVSVFDVYGMEPDFLDNNYGSVGLKAETSSAMKAVEAAVADAPKP